MKTVCFFGSYTSSYSRNLLTKKAFKKLGWEVTYCNDQGGGIRHYKNLLLSFFKEGKDCSIIFIPVIGHFDVPLAWVLAKVFKKRLIFDAFYSLYDTYVEDRKSVSRFSIKALRYTFYDWIAVILSDKVILDTKENMEYFIKRYKLSSQKFYELPVTVDEDIFKPRSKKVNKKFTIGFYGSFMPLHGVDLIVNSIYELRDQDIKCILLGIGPGVKDIQKQVKKLKLEKVITIINKKIDYEELPEFIASVDIFLSGPFGSTDKAKRVLPLKAVESLSLNQSTIVAKTPTTFRLLGSYKGEIHWLEEITPTALAKLIIKLKEKSRKSINRHQDYFSSSDLSFKSYTNKLSSILSSR